MTTRRLAAILAASRHSQTRMVGLYLEGLRKAGLLD
jgi:hypothetical protein